MAKKHLYTLTLLRSAARIPALRSAAVLWSKWKNPNGRVSGESIFEELKGVEHCDHHVQQLRSNGFSLGLSLSPAIVSDLTKQFFSQTLTEDGTGRKMDAASAIQAGGSPALRWLNPHHANPLVSRIAHDKQLISIASQYLGCQPILHSTQMWLLNPPTEQAAASAEYGWHYDIDDFRFLKVFFYLTDTAETDGQHMLVSRSHNDIRPHRLLNRRISDANLRSKYPAENIHRMDGAAGEGFFEDTWLYHKATPPTSQRIMFQIEYCATGIMKHLEHRL